MLKKETRYSEKNDLYRLDFALSQDHVVHVFLTRLGAVTGKVALGVWVLSRLGNASLPAKQHGHEVPEVELRPHHIEEDNLGVLVALPKHKVTQPFDARGSDEDVQRRSALGQHVAG